jgi:3-hydroxyisobutyrate dehydrogenase
MIGFVGVGRMGLPVCANLVRAGYQVAAFDRRPERAAAIRAAGATSVGSAAEAAADADVLVTVLPGPPEVVEAMTGVDGALERLRPGATWIDMTSNAAAVAAPVQALAQERGVEVLEAPMGGGIDAATNATLKLFVGGPAALVERHRPLLSTVADPERLVHVGGLGAGYTTKLLVNLLWFGQAVATTEALLLGRRAGLDLTVLRAALADSAAASEFVRRDLDAVFAGDRMPSFGLDRCCEELANITAQARELGVPFALSELVDEVHRRASARYGDVDGELMAVALLEEESGISLRTG